MKPIGILWTGLALLTLAANGRAAEAKPLNVVVFLIDDLGWTDCSCYGSDLNLTPNIDRLAREGMRFTQAYAACTVCSPTRAALMTGKYPARLHLTDWIHGHKRPNARLAIPKWTEYLPLEEVTVAEVLKKAGYDTGHIGKWHLGDTPEYWPDRQGFDLNLGGTGKGQPPSYFSPYKIPTLKDGPPGEYLTDREAAEAVRYLEKHRERPFFLYIPHHAVHTPLQGKKDLIAKFEKRRTPQMRHTNLTYAAMLASVDDSVGLVLAKLEELKLTERTLVIFTGDNGGLIGGARARVTTNVPLRAGKGSAYEGGVRVPLIIRGPGVKAGTVCQEPVITMDLFATILALAGNRGGIKNETGCDGISLVPLLRDPTASLKRDAIYWHYPHYHPGGATPYSAIRAGDWRLVEFFEDNHVELYNLKEDVGEKKDLAKVLPEKAKTLTAQLHAWRKAVGAQLPTPNPNYKPEAKP